MANFLKQIRSALTGYEYHVVTVFYLRHQCRYRCFHLTTNSVAMHGVTVLFADGKPNFGLLNIACAVQHQKVSVANAFCMFVNVVILIVFFKSVDRLQIVDLLLCGKFVTTFSATTSEYSTSTGCLHSCSKTVHFASLSFLGLVSSFHFSVSFMSAHLRQNYLDFCLLGENTHNIHHSIQRHFIKSGRQSQVFGLFWETIYLYYRKFGEIFCQT